MMNMDTKSDIMFEYTKFNLPLGDNLHAMGAHSIIKGK